MLDVQLFDLHTFLPKPYEEALLPRLKKPMKNSRPAPVWAENSPDGCICPRRMTGRNLLEFRLPPRRSKAILRRWWSSASAAAIWEPAA